ncbi:hypothetical protein J3R83DRAFT_2972 [Lanmaoa asiatica]|nr:hypothetical protein J3R83DRAFT_2972 [Lanmaoa asiatica]
MLSLGQVIQTINHSTYKLDMTGVVGLFGGNNAVDALETIHLYTGRKWVGWYNYPGAATVAKRFGQMANSRLWDSLFPGPNESPAVTFNLAGKSGPDYSGSISGTKVRTKYLGYLTAEACKGHSGKALQFFRKDGTEARKTGNSAAVTVISLSSQQHGKISRSLTTASVSVTKEKHEFIQIKPKSDPLALWAIVPSLISMLACAFCLVGQDPLGASLILLGIVSSGFSSLALGMATLKIHVPVPSIDSPPGDGLMILGDGSAVVLKGEEADVNIITKGEFQLDYSKGILPHDKHHTIGVCSLLLQAQFLIQLLLIPLTTFFSQIAFLISFIASGVYHLYVASYHRELIHQELLFRELSARMEKRILGTRTQMAVFVCLMLGDSGRYQLMSSPDDVLSCILPNETPVWRYWRRKVSKELVRFGKWDSASSLPYAPIIQAEPENQADIDEHSRFTEQDKGLLDDLIDDAWCVFNGYPRYRTGESEVGRERDEDKAYLLRGGSPA